MTTKRENFFRPPVTTEHIIQGLKNSLNTTDADFDISENELSDGQNTKQVSETSLAKRDGISVYGPFLGTTTGILGGFNFINRVGTQEMLVVYNTTVNRHTTTTSTALTGVTMTTNLPADGVYFPFTDKFYITNGTDAVVKYTSGAAGDQTDAAFKKGKYIEQFQNRLLVGNVSGQESRVWYTDVQTDTFSANNWFEVDGSVIGIKTYYDKVLIFTKLKVYRLANFVFDGTTSWVSNLFDIPTEFGTISDRTIQAVNNRIYFLGQNKKGVADIYVTDGMGAVPIGNRKIKDTLATLSASQLANACAIADGNTYRVEVAETGKTTNTITLHFNTVNNLFYPPERRFIENRASFSCLWSSETSGQWDVYGGTQGTGQVYKLHANDGLYDELGEERYLTSGSYNAPIDANPAKRVAQSFKLSNYNTTQSVYITKAALNLKKVSGTTTGLTVRIETNNAGSPSGTLANANATTTIAAFTSTSYAWQMATFATAFTLTGNTTYWLVVQHTTEGSGDSKYSWLADSCTSTYTNGNLGSYQSSAWVADSLSDANFILYDQSPIDAYFDSKALLVNRGKEYQLHRFETIFSTVGNYSVEIGFTYGTLSTYTTFYVNLSGMAGTTYDGGFTYDGTAFYDSASENRKYTWTEVSGFVGKVLKQRIRNRNANQQFKYNTTIIEVSKRMRQS